MAEYMVRWKRNARNRWYYLPIVFDTPKEAQNRVPATTKTSEYYKIEIVEIQPVQVWTTDEPDIQGSTVEPATEVAG